jgi:hypothetical protein
MPSTCPFGHDLTSDIRLGWSIANAFSPYIHPWVVEKDVAEKKIRMVIDQEESEEH